jgi:predicted nuclease of predicted toxin-antitoxin system
MRLLLDESVPARLYKALPNHHVSTAMPALEAALATLQPRTYVLVSSTK